VTYIVIFGSQKQQGQAIVFSLGEAARFAVRYMQERRPQVRICLPDGKILGFEAFQQAIFSGNLTETSIPNAQKLIDRAAE
jgi:hypothetical protein